MYTNTICIFTEKNLKFLFFCYIFFQRAKVFPDYFYTFLQSYMQIFSTDPHMTSDQKITKIHENLDILISNVENNEVDVEGLTLICGLVTANIRSLKFAGAKVKATEILSKLAKKLSSEVILDRILPFVVRLQLKFIYKSLIIHYFFGKIFLEFRICLALKTFFFCFRLHYSRIDFHQSELQPLIVSLIVSKL